MSPDLDLLEMDETPKRTRRKRTQPTDLPLVRDTWPRCKTCRFWTLLGELTNYPTDAAGLTYGRCKFLTAEHNFENRKDDEVCGVYAYNMPPTGAAIMTLETFGCIEYKPKPKRRK